MLSNKKETAGAEQGMSRKREASSQHCRSESKSWLVGARMKEVVSHGRMSLCKCVCTSSGWSFWEAGCKGTELSSSYIAFGQREH